MIAVCAVELVIGFARLEPGVEQIGRLVIVSLEWQSPARAPLLVMLPAGVHA